MFQLSDVYRREGQLKSLMDYIFRRLALKFLPASSPPPQTGAEDNQTTVPAPASPCSDGIRRDEADAPACKGCGSITTRNGSCYKCSNCGGAPGASLARSEGPLAADTFKASPRIVSGNADNAGVDGDIHVCEDSCCLVCEKTRARLLHLSRFHRLCRFIL